MSHPISNTIPNHGYVTSSSTSFNPIPHMPNYHQANTFGSGGYPQNYGGQMGFCGGGQGYFPYNNQFFMSSGNMMTGWGMGGRGYSQVALPAESRMEYIPYESCYIDYIPQQFCQSVLIPYQRQGQKYYQIQHITDYEPRQYEQTIVDMVPHERIKERVQYLPVQTHIVHYPDQNKPLYHPQQQQHHIHTTQHHHIKQNIRPENQIRPNNNTTVLQGQAPSPRPPMPQMTSNTLSPNMIPSNQHQFRNNISTRQVNHQIVSNQSHSNQFQQNQFQAQNLMQQNIGLSSRSGQSPFVSNSQNQGGVSEKQIAQTLLKYPPPYSQEGQLAGGQIKSHHRTVTSKPLKQPFEQNNLNTSLQKKRSDTMNLVNLANESVHQQLSTPSGSMVHRNSGTQQQQNLGSSINLPAPPPPPPPPMTTTFSNQSSQGGIPTLKYKQSSHISNDRGYDDSD